MELLLCTATKNYGFVCGTCVIILISRPFNFFFIFMASNYYVLRAQCAVNATIHIIALAKEEPLAVQFNSCAVFVAFRCIVYLCVHACAYLFQLFGVFPLPEGILI